MRVLLVNLAAGDTDFIDKGRVWRSIYRRPYLGLQYLSAYLTQHGHAVDLIDCQVEDLTPRELAARARVGGYGLVGFFAIYVNREALLACAQPPGGADKQVRCCSGHGYWQLSPLLSPCANGTVILNSCHGSLSFLRSHWLSSLAWCSSTKIHFHASGKMLPGRL